MNVKSKKIIESMLSSVESSMKETSHVNDENILIELKKIIKNIFSERLKVQEGTAAIIYCAELKKTKGYVAPIEQEMNIKGVSYIKMENINFTKINIRSVSKLEIITLVRAAFRAACSKNKLGLLKRINIIHSYFIIESMVPSGLRYYITLMPNVQNSILFRYAVKEKSPDAKCFVLDWGVSQEKQIDIYKNDAFGMKWYGSPKKEYKNVFVYGNPGVDFLVLSKIKKNCEFDLVIIDPGINKVLQRNEYLEIMKCLVRYLNDEYHLGGLKLGFKMRSEGLMDGHIKKVFRNYSVEYIEKKALDDVMVDNKNATYIHFSSTARFDLASFGVRQINIDYSESLGVQCSPYMKGYFDFEIKLRYIKDRKTFLSFDGGDNDNIGRLNEILSVDFSREAIGKFI